MTNSPTPNPRHTTPRTDFPPAGSGLPYAGFEGVVDRSIAASTSWWADRPKPSDDAPDVITILLDDVGFSDLGCFGGEIDTPHLDRLAAEGLTFTNFHVTPMCSPSRASMLTGMAAHSAGVAHVCHSDPGFPAYDQQLAPDVATMPEILRDAGYHTLMVGKWHLAKDSDLGDAGPRHSWPLQRGYDRYYGLLDGFTNFHQPHRLVEDNHTVETDQYPDDYYLTDDLTDRAIGMIRAAKAADPTTRINLYLAHGAAHAPLHAKPDMIAKYADRYHVGWDEIRSARHLRSQELGVVPQGVKLPPRNSEPGYEAPPWDELPATHREVFARYMATYAAMIEHVDVAFGRLRAALEQLGTWDNTLIVFTSDNGASREGGTTGTTSYYTHLGGDIGIEKDHARLDLIGGPQVMAHYPQGWAMACNTPYRLYKTTTHQGGRHVPMILSWPNRITDPGTKRTQFVHLSDVLPTVLEATGVTAPDHRGGQPLKPITGTSFLPIVDDATLAAANTEQLFELGGNRGYVSGNWEIVSLHTALTTFTDAEWQLYDLNEDPTETNDLAAEHPERVAELSAAWEQAAWDQQVFPLDEGSGLKFMIRPDRNEVFERPITIPAGTHTLERWRSLQFILLRSCTITIRCDLDEGDAGMLVAHGDQGGGYATYVDDGRLWFVHNDGHGDVTHLDGGPLAPGEHTIEVLLDAVGGGVWTVTVTVDDKQVATQEGVKILFPMAPFEGIDVGICRRSPVSWTIYEQHGPFPFTGTLHDVTFTPGDHAPDSPWQYMDAIRDMAMTYD